MKVNYPSNKYTQEEFTYKVVNINPELEVIGEYKGFDSQVEVRHKACDNSFLITAGKILKKYNCRKCQAKEKKISKIKSVIDNSDGLELMSISDDLNVIKYRHLYCNSIFEKKYSTFMLYPSCKICNKEKQSDKCRMSIDDFTTRINNIHGERSYEIIGDYINTLTHIKVKHNCGYTYDALPVNMLKGKGCIKCASKKRGENRRVENTDFISRFNSCSNGEYKIIGEFKMISDYIKVQHISNNCNHVYKVKANNFIHGKRCPICKSSKGEKAISKFLDDNDIKYVPQFEFEDCKHLRKLKFDFAIFDNDDKLNMLIEFDGEQHFKSNEFFGGKDSFEVAKKRDKIKDKYCKDNDLVLLRIPYWDILKIDSILSDILLP